MSTLSSPCLVCLVGICVGLYLLSVSVQAWVITSAESQWWFLQVSSLPAKICLTSLLHTFLNLEGRAFYEDSSFWTEYSPNLSLSELCPFEGCSVNSHLVQVQSSLRVLSEAMIWRYRIMSVGVVLLLSSLCRMIVGGFPLGHLTYLVSYIYHLCSFRYFLYHNE